MFDVCKTMQSTLVIAKLLMKWKTIKIISDVRHRIITYSTPPPPPQQHTVLLGGGGGGEGWARQHHSARNVIIRRANLIARDAWSITLIPLPAIIALLRPLPLPPSHLLTVSSRLYGPHKVLSHRVNPSRAAPLNYICLLCFARRGGWRGNGRRNWISRKVFGSRKDCVTLFFQ